MGMLFVMTVSCVAIQSTVLVTAANHHDEVEEVPCRCPYPTDPYYERGAYNIFDHERRRGGRQLSVIDATYYTTLSPEGERILPEFIPACWEIEFICPGEEPSFPIWNYTCIVKDDSSSKQKSSSSSSSSKNSKGSKGDKRQRRRELKKSKIGSLDGDDDYYYDGNNDDDVDEDELQGMVHNSTELFDQSNSKRGKQRSRGEKKSKNKESRRKSTKSKRASHIHSKSSYQQK